MKFVEKMKDFFVGESQVKTQDKEIDKNPIKISEKNLCDYDSYKSRESRKITNKTKLHRLQLDFSELAYDKLIRLKEFCGAKSVSIMIRDALGFYEWYVEQKNQKAEFFVKKNGETEKITFID